LTDKLSINLKAWKLLEKLCKKARLFNITVKKANTGTIIVDAGVEAKGGFQAGTIITEICMGGCGKAEIVYKNIGTLGLPSIFIYTDHPVIATLGSQFAGWNIKEGDYFAIGSGPARALALKPKSLYEKIGYEDSSEKAVVVFETSDYPPEKIIKQLADECKVSPDNLGLILTPTTSIAGSTQIAGRVVETGIHKLDKLGLDPKSILHACGYAPIPPVHLKFSHAMARTNDTILYGGTTYYTVNYEDEEELEKIIHKAPSKASPDYGRPFIEIFKEANYDFYKIDSNLFAPAVVVVNNIKTGNVIRAGEVNPEILGKSLGF
jgi:methenyltetrahydromethanopterin cyclohydrolase